VDALLGLADEVFPVELEDALAARDLVAPSGGLSVRDALHVAVMRRRGVRRVFSFDAGFDTVDGIERICE
jgi:predicted nucleic acid-binding protein